MLSARYDPVSLMKLQIYSDLHNEFSRFEPATNYADVVILAGDIDLKSRGVKWANEVFQCPIIYVCGNHEYYGGHLHHTLRKMKEAAKPHVHVLENEVLILEQTRFLVATAWTDYSSTGNVVAGKRISLEWMNDFTAIRTDASYRRVRPDDLIAKSKAAYGWLSEELDKTFEGKTVVVTHHAPSLDYVGDYPPETLIAAYENV